MGHYGVAVAYALPFLCVCLDAHRPTQTLAVIVLITSRLAVFFGWEEFYNSSEISEALLAKKLTSVFAVLFKFFICNNLIKYFHV